jgi:CBS domain containing-hemolysin-like protein
MPVAEIMTRDVVTVTPCRTVDDCMAVMTDRHIRHLPVLDDDQVVGLVSIGDLVKAQLDDQRFVIEQLEHYIASGTHGPGTSPGPHRRYRVGAARRATRPAHTAARRELE